MQRCWPTGAGGRRFQALNAVRQLLRHLPRAVPSLPCRCLTPAAARRSTPLTRRGWRMAIAENPPLAGRPATGLHWVYRNDFRLVPRADTMRRKLPLRSLPPAVRWGKWTDAGPHFAIGCRFRPPVDAFRPRARQSTAGPALSLSGERSSECRCCRSPKGRDRCCPDGYKSLRTRLQLSRSRSGDRTAFDAPAGGELVCSRDLTRRRQAELHDQHLGGAVG